MTEFILTRGDKLDVYVSMFYDMLYCMSLPVTDVIDEEAEPVNGRTVSSATHSTWS